MQIQLHFYHKTIGVCGYWASDQMSHYFAVQKDEEYVQLLLGYFYLIYKMQLKVKGGAQVDFKDLTQLQRMYSEVKGHFKKNHKIKNI